MTPIRIGAVGYLNARPLVWQLEQEPGLSVRFDVPSRCAALLHEGQTDLGLVPSIEYARHGDYRIVSRAAVTSFGPVASVALYARVPLERVRRVALDDSSRTSAALLRILCARHFDLAPRFEACAPDVSGMLREHDAALLIGDPALYLDHETMGLLKVDLGDAWTGMTGLPFVWAFWAGRVPPVTSRVATQLTLARDRGAASLGEVAQAFCRTRPDRLPQSVAYLRDNIGYDIGPVHERGLMRFFELAADLQLAPRVDRLDFLPTEDAAEQAVLGGPAR